MLTILILSYNRPIELERLLRSILDELNSVKCFGISVLVAEDCSPRQVEIKQVVDNYIPVFNEIGIELTGNYNILNRGYDGNFREAMSLVKSKYAMIFGDDDVFEIGALNKIESFLKESPDLRFVLRAWKSTNIRSKKTEDFRYFSNSFVKRANDDVLVEIFRKSIFISGLIFDVEFAKRHSSCEFDGTLLYQLYLISCLCDRDCVGYIAEPIVRRFEGGEFFFGSSSTEKDFSPNVLLPEHSLNFARKIVLIISKSPWSDALKDRVMLDFSKYSLPLLLIQRRSLSLSEYVKYAEGLASLGFNRSNLFNFYFVALFVLGANLTENLVIWLKKILKRTPQL